MASKKLEEMLTRFATELHALVAEEVRTEIAKNVQAALDTQPVALMVSKAGRRTGYTYTFAEKPCPVCGKLNRGRRWRYYCKDHLAANSASAQ